MAKAKAKKSDESAGEVSKVPRAKLPKCKFCGVSAPPAINNRNEARCEACYELLPFEE